MNEKFAGKLISIIRDADLMFTDGGTVHYVKECLIPLLNVEGIVLSQHTSDDIILYGGSPDPVHSCLELKDYKQLILLRSDIEQMPKEWQSMLALLLAELDKKVNWLSRSTGNSI